jgi:hypothetical protein
MDQVKKPDALGAGALDRRAYGSSKPLRIA